MNNDRYIVAEDENYEPGSNHEVLKNFLKIKDLQTIEILEEEELKRTGIELTELYDKTHRFSSRIFVIFTPYGWRVFIPLRGSIEQVI